MKKLLLFFLISNVLIVDAQTSVYHPFPDDSATWCTSICGNQGNSFNEATYQLNGKILINGIWYSRMYHYEKSCYGAGSCVCGGLNGSDTTTYYIRQDVVQKKVWIYIPLTNSDTIFLDFNLNIGDTIDGTKAYWAGQFSYIGIVTAIDSVQIGTQYRTRYEYDDQGFHNYLIEGIGPDHGFFYPSNHGYDFWPALKIFSQFNQLFYPYYSTDTIGMGNFCYQFPTGTDEIIETPFLFSFPNPSTENFTLNFGHYLKEGSIEIYSTIGENIWNGSIQNESKKEITLKNVCGRIYFIKVFDGKKSICKKIIIQ